MARHRAQLLQPRKYSFSGHPRGTKALRGRVMGQSIFTDNPVVFSTNRLSERWMRLGTWRY